MPVKQGEYRADVNGLRAIAVLAVVANHVGWFLKGGFLGVDVFFVISGYLISGIVYREITAGNFSIGRFYERRARRILPALTVMLLATLPLAYFYLLPFEMKTFAQSLLAATFCVSNLYFWKKSGYFDSFEKPLLHTWSLAVEEQFYIFFPAFLLLGYRFFREKLNRSLVVICLASFIASAIGAVYFRETTFYLAPTRAWELLLGALIALEILPEIRGNLQRNLASGAGLLLIAGPIIAFSKYTLPSLATLLPCVGAALIIAAGRSGSTLAGKALSAKPLVFLGLISYSLYLWHWPLIVFHKIGFLPMTGLPWRIENTVIIALSIVAATLSWKYVETPFRSKQIPSKAVFRFAFSSLGALAAISVGLIASNGLALRFPPQVARIALYEDYDPQRVSRLGTCFLTSGDMRIDEQRCLHEERRRPNYLLIGDSHAAHLWYGLATVFPKLNIMQATIGACKPTIARAPGERVQCRKMLDHLYRDFIPDHKLDAILIEARWTAEDLGPLAATLDYAKEHTGSVLLFGPMVQYDTDLPNLLAVSMLKNDPAYPFRHVVMTYARLDAEMARIAKQKHVRYISFYAMLCGAHACETTAKDGTPVLYDTGHLTAEGSVEVAMHMRDREELP